MKIKFVSAAEGESVAVPVYEKRTLSEAAAGLDETSGGAITRAIEASRFNGDPGDLLEIIAPAGLEEARVVLFGLGQKDALTGNSAEKAVAGVVRDQLTKGAKTLSIHLNEGEGEIAARAGLGARFGGYRFDIYRTTLKEAKKPSLKTVELITADKKAAKKAWKDWEPVAEGVALARDLVMEPPNILHPEAYAKRLKNLKIDGLEVEALGEKEMKALGMGALLGVGQGSAKESQLVVMRWNGGEAGDKPIAFVGKGVSFDTGGISLKPPQGMDEMKADMGGSAAVVGTMAALAGRKAKVNAVGVVALVENMPDGEAQRPGDIVTSMSGQTIEVLNTDAEGRLILADALWYAQKELDPAAIIDLATLTGAMVVALGHEYAGAFSNDETLSDRLVKAGAASDERVWPMPIGDAYDRLIDSEVADVKNISADRWAGAIIGAVFLQRFVNKKPWCHIDIAGTGMYANAKDPRLPSFGTGYGVRLLDRFVRDFYEA